MTIESDRPFLPEAQTPLFHTSVYARLDPAQRLRYNQLHGLYANEQILFFEQALAEDVLGALVRQPLPDHLGESLRRFRDDEAAHSIMFREVNQACAPELYARGDFHFIRVPVGAWHALRAIGRRPIRFPLLVWLMLIQEERAIPTMRFRAVPKAALLAVVTGLAGSAARASDLAVSAASPQSLLARALQHEIDHLDGMLFLDRLRGVKRDLIVRKIRKLQRAGRW